MRLSSVKKVVSFIIALSMIMTLVPSVFAASVSDFTDFPTGWSREAMVAAVENGLLLGKSDTVIAPTDELTRAEMVTIINRSFGATVEANITSYLDVPADAWYYHEIAKGVNMQTIEGDSASIMRPEDSITREEVFTVIARALVFETEDYSSLDKFSDGDDVSDWAKKYIAALVAKGYVNGDDTGKINAHNNITREEFAQVMHNIIKTYYVEKGTYTTTGLASDLIRTSDVHLKDITIDGDLIIGDGVGYGTITLTNVTIKGRLVCRGGEKAIKLVNTTVEDKVVVKDVNGIVHFDNYRDEAVFDDILMITHATFKTRIVSTGGGSYRPPAHRHNWSTEWTTNDTHHWHECLTANCTITENSEKNGYDVHTFDDEHDEYCNTCNYYREVTPPAHEHNWTTEWITNDTHHWHDCLAADCPIVNNSEKDGYGEHTYDNDQDEYCNTCNHYREVAPPSHEHNWSTEWTTNDTHHWHECLEADCPIVINSQKNGYGVHTYDNDQDENCNICNHHRDVVPSAEEYTVEFYNGMIKDDEPIATQKVEKDNTLNGIDVTIDDVYTDNGVVITGNEIIYAWDGKDIYDGTFTHSVAPEYIYFNEKDGVNQWEVFTEDTVLDEDTVGSDKILEVYYAYKNIAVLLSNIIPIEVLKTVSINADYNSQARVSDTIKVLMINTRDQLEKGGSAIEDKQTEIFTLIGDKTGGMITPEGIINKKAVSLKITDVIPYSRVEDAVETYVYGVLESGTDKEIEEISGYMDSAALPAYIASVKAARGNSADLNSIKEQAIENLKAYAPYTELLKAFEAKKETFNISDENMAFAKAIGDEVESFSYAEIKPYLENKGYGPIIQLMGKDKDGNDNFAATFAESQAAYVAGLDAEIAKVQADNTVETKYTTSLSVNMDVVAILENVYSKITEEAMSLFAGKEIYLYEENEALKKFVNIDWFNVFIKETGDGRHQINDFFSMYDAMIDTFILIDEAICWYGDPANYPSSDYETVKSELASDMTSYIDSVMNIVDQITTGQPIGGKYTINELIAKVQDLNNIAGALGDSSLAGYEDTINTLVDTMTNILTNLGQGELPGGYSLETVNKLCEKLKTAISNLDSEQYDLVNKEANDMIKRALTKLDAMFDELDKDGTIRGKSLESFINKFSFLEDIFDQYGSQIKNIISIIANADIDESNIDIDSEWMVDVFFGADEDNRFTIDNLIEMAPDKFKTEVNDYTETADETYIVDYYQVKSGEASVKAQRTIR